jgi:hypothetical protein
MSVELAEQEVEEKEVKSEEKTSPEQQEADAEQSEKAESGKEAVEAELALLKQLQEEGSITKRADGKFEWVVDPDDPKTTRYVGGDLKELLQNARKGFIDKDRYIAELKSKNFGVEKPGRRAGQEQRERTEDDEDIESLTPNRDLIITELMKERGLDPQMRGWSNTQWREYADEKGMRDFEVSRIQQAIDRAEADANVVYKDQSIDYVDAKTLKEASEEIKQYMLDKKLDPDEFIDTYKDVVTRTWEDPTYRKSNGLFNGTRLVRVMISEIDQKAAPSPERTKVQKKLDEVKKTADESKKQIKTPQSAAAKPKVTEAPPKDIREAKRQLLDRMKAGRLP